MNLIILASGRGSRLSIITKDKPKCLTRIYQKKSLLDFIKENFYLVKNIIIATGYKSHFIENHLKDQKIKFVKNKNFKNTNMVESLMLCKKKLINKDIIVIYGDIFFDKKIIEKLVKLEGNILPLNSAWLKSWKKRYKLIKQIKTDAEDIKVSRIYIKSIGEKIKNKLPKYQYMGIIKIDTNSFNRLFRFYKILNNKNISMTKFINESIKRRIANFIYFISNKYWYELDILNVLKFLKKNIKKLL